MSCFLSTVSWGLRVPPSNFLRASPPLPSVSMLLQPCVSVVNTLFAQRVCAGILCECGTRYREMQGDAGLSLPCGCGTSTDHTYPTGRSKAPIARGCSPHASCAPPCRTYLAQPAHAHSSNLLSLRALAVCYLLCVLESEFFEVIGKLLHQGVAAPCISQPRDHTAAPRGCYQASHFPPCASSRDATSCVTTH